MSDEHPSASAITQALQALKGNPVVVGMLLLNVLFVAAAAWYLISTANTHSEHLKLILDRCLPKGG